MLSSRNPLKRKGASGFSIIEGCFNTVGAGRRRQGRKGALDLNFTEQSPASHLLFVCF